MKGKVLGSHRESRLLVPLLDMYLCTVALAGLVLLSLIIS
jgi:hypothetical protein